MNTNWLIFGTAVYFVLFLGAVLAIGMWTRSRRKEKHPVAFKLLRAPGESLRRKLTEFDESLLGQLTAASLVPVVLGYCLLWALAKIAPKMNLWLGLSLTGTGFLLCAILSGRWLWGKLVVYRNHRLGYLGERYVGEQLAHLVGYGFRIFHDMPAEGTRKSFNLDHVVVGPTGVWIIETKTRRKGRARPGFKEHEVVFDGKQLIWPWGEDRHGLEQTSNEARWLTEWIKTRTNIAIEVRGILTLPGWMVIEKSLGKVRVLNTKNVPSAIRGRGVVVLNQEQIELISLQLDLACRDVED